MSAPSDSPPPVAPRPRFSWPMRFFLGFLVFDLVYSNLASLTPFDDWVDELGMTEYPRGLPDPAERAELAQVASADNPHPVRDRVLDSFASFGDYFTPWPNVEVRKNINNPLDAGKFAHCWIATRLRFFEKVVLVKQGWTMFSPNVSTFDVLVRARLVYADGSAITIRSIADPSNIARHETFRGFLSEKPVEYSTALERDPVARLGYCNLLAHRHPVNDAGSPLVTILLICMRYDYPEPSTATRAALERQNVPLGKEPNTPFFKYDVRSRRGWMTSWWSHLFSGLDNA